MYTLCIFNALLHVVPPRQVPFSPGPSYSPGMKSFLDAQQSVHSPIKVNINQTSVISKSLTQFCVNMLSGHYNQLLTWKVV